MVFVLFMESKPLKAQTLAFPGAEGFGKYTVGARGAANPEVYVVTNLNDSGAGSFRDACSKPGRFIVFAVGGIIRLSSDIVVPANTTIAGQTALGDGVVLFGKRVTFSGANNTIARFLKIRLGATDNRGKDASGISNGKDLIFDHLSVTWGMDEVFSINWDSKGNNPDNITIQNSILGQGLHRDNHSAGGLIQPSAGGKISLIRNLYSSNKTRNPKVKGINEFVNNVVYNWGNYGNTYGHTESGDAYIMGGDSQGESFVNIINNYFISGPSTRDNLVTPFNRGNSNFYLYASGNYFDNNKDGVLNGTLVPLNLTGYPTGDENSFQLTPYDYPAKNPVMTAEDAFNWVCDNVGASYPRRDQVDGKMISDLRSVGTQGIYLYRETDMPLSNGGLGDVFSAPAPLDTDKDGIPDAWEDANGLDKNDKTDAVKFSLSQPEYMNIEVYVNSLVYIAPEEFIKPPTNVALSSISQELPVPQSTITITWKDNADNEDNFVIEKSLNGTDYTTLVTLGANVITHSDTGLPNTKYWYRIKAVNAEGESAYSAPVLITTQPIPTAPDKASIPQPGNGYKYVETSTGSFSLTWTGSANTASYKVYFGDSESNLINVAEVTAKSYTATNLVAGSIYYWRIDAINDKGTATGDVWSFRVMPSIPDGLVGHWSFDDILENGSQVTDSSPYENHGALGLEGNQNVRVAGKVNSAVDFATARQDMYVVSIPNEDQLYLSNRSFSMTFWMKAPASLLPQDNNTSAYLLCKGSITKNAATGATGNRFDIEFKNKQIRFAIDNDNRGKDELQVPGAPFFTNEWVHVTAIRDFENKKLKIYLNGALQQEQTIVNAIDNIGEESALVIGNIGELEFLSSSNQPAPYKGMLDELKIYNYSLTQNQILEEFHTSPLPLQVSNVSPLNTGVAEQSSQATVSWTGGFKTNQFKVYLGTSADNLSEIAEVNVSTKKYQFTNLSVNTTYYWRVDAIGDAGTTTGIVWSFKTAAYVTEIVADWKLDATSGTVITDNSAYANHGTINNVTDYAWEAGKFNNSLNLKTVAANSAISIPSQDQIKFDKNSFSISMWMKSSSTTPAYLFHKGTFAKNAGTGATGKWYGVELKNNLIYFSVDDDVNKSTAQFNSATFLTNNWVHVVFVRNITDKTLKIYRDGVQVVSATENNTSLTNGIGAAEALFLANNNDLNAPFKGALDEVKFYNYALSATEISNLSQTNTLPVTLVDFVSKAEGNQVKIQWTTASENKNEKFVVEKSTNGKDFSFLQEVKGSGTTTAVNLYTAWDNSPSVGTNYYRLSQYDLDGGSQIIGLSSVKFNLGKQNAITVYPNPAGKQINVSVAEDIRKANISIVSLRGEEIYNNQLVAEDGVFKVNLLEKPQSGIYILRISSGTINHSSKLVIE